MTQFLDKLFSPFRRNDMTRNKKNIIIYRKTIFFENLPLYKNQVATKFIFLSTYKFRFVIIFVLRFWDFLARLNSYFLPQYSTVSNRSTVCAYCFWDQNPFRACLLDTVSLLFLEKRIRPVWLLNQCFY